ncbi:MAG: hypothetical protein ACRDT4_14325 [Micromonosporaceae bacterium]
MTYPPAGGQFPAPASPPYGGPQVALPYGGPPQAAPSGTGGRPGVLTMVVVFLWLIAGLSVLGALASLGFSLMRGPGAGTIALQGVNLLSALLVAAVAGAAAALIPNGRDLGRVLGLVVAGYVALESVTGALRTAILLFMNSGALSGVVSILITLAVGGAAALVFVQLLRSDVVAWFRAMSDQPSAPGGSYPQG